MAALGLFSWVALGLLCMASGRVKIFEWQPQSSIGKFVGGFIAAPVLGMAFYVLGIIGAVLVAPIWEILK